jgi:EmrB/QacA subfamily drug resistance transporter
VSPNEGAVATRIEAAAAGAASDQLTKTPSRWLIFGIVSLALMMSSVDSTIVATALPTLRHALHAPLNWASWTITAYQLGLVIAMPIAGRVSDQLGRKQVFVVSAVLFTTASLACGLVDNVGLLIALRVVQAVGGGAFLPASTGLVADAFGSGRDRALGLFSSIFPLGALLGPVVGGILIAVWSWRGVFLVNVPIGITFTVLAIRYLPRTPAVHGHTDLRGAFFMGTCILSAMLAIVRLGYRGATVLSAGFLLPLAVAAASGWWFVRRAGRVREPLIPAALLRGRAFVLMNLINFVWGGCVIGMGALVPLYAEQRYHLAPLAAGTLLTARSLAEIGCAIAASMALRRIGYRIPMVVGFSLLVVGLVLITVRPPVLGAYAWLAIATAITGLGTGASAPAANNATLDLSPDDVGAISGLRGAVRQSGSIVVVAVATSVVSRSSHESAALAGCFIGMAILLASVTGVVFAAVPRGAGTLRRAR